MGTALHVDEIRYLPPTHVACEVLQVFLPPNLSPTTLPRCCYIFPSVAWYSQHEKKSPGWRNSLQKVWIPKKAYIKYLCIIGAEEGPLVFIFSASSQVFLWIDLFAIIEFINSACSEAVACIMSRWSKIGQPLTIDFFFSVDQWAKTYPPLKAGRAGWDKQEELTCWW